MMRSRDPLLLLRWLDVETAPFAGEDPRWRHAQLTRNRLQILMLGPVHAALQPRDRDHADPDASSEIFLRHAPFAARRSEPQPHAMSIHAQRINAMRIKCKGSRLLFSRLLLERGSKGECPHDES